MDKYFNLLSKSSLFQGFSSSELQNFLIQMKTSIREYPKDSVLALEGENCVHIGIVLEGQLELHNLYPSGRSVTVTHLRPGDTFGEAILFAPQHHYPISIQTTQPSQILFINRQVLLNGLSANPALLENFLGLLSQKLLMLNRRVRILSMDSIRQKLCDYILTLYKKQQTLNLHVPINRQKLADLLGIQRPSLSRELIHMKEDGLIFYDKNTITILDLEGLEFEL